MYAPARARGLTAVVETLRAVSAPRSSTVIPATNCEYPLRIVSARPESVPESISPLKYVECEPEIGALALAPDAIRVRLAYERVGDPQAGRQALFPQRERGWVGR